MKKIYPAIKTKNRYEANKPYYAALAILWGDKILSDIDKITKKK